MGVSSRVTNDNARCKLMKETRLCNIRPCSSMSVPVKVRNVCDAFKIPNKRHIRALLLMGHNYAAQPPCKMESGKVVSQGGRLVLISWHVYRPHP